MSQPKKPELKLTGNVAENFKNFEMRFNDYCIESEYREYIVKGSRYGEIFFYKKPIIEISALRSTNQSPHESVQDWETRVRQSGSLCNYGALTDQMYQDKFIFGIQDSDIRTELLKCHLKPDKTEKALSDVVGEARALESARQTNK